MAGFKMHVIDQQPARLRLRRRGRTSTACRRTRRSWPARCAASPACCPTSTATTARRSARRWLHRRHRPDAAPGPLRSRSACGTTKWCCSASSIYLFMRFGITNMIRKYTVHRGMFHSIPAVLDLRRAGVLDLRRRRDLDVRYYKAGGVIAGFMSHLILDEIYSVEWKGGRWRLKKSSGTAIKFWGDDALGQLLAATPSWSSSAAMILGEPSVMQQTRSPQPGIRATLPGAAERSEAIGGCPADRATLVASRHRRRPTSHAGRRPTRASAQPPIAADRQQLPPTSYAAQLRPLAQLRPRTLGRHRKCQ